MDRGDWWATVHGVTKSQAWLSTQTWHIACAPHFRFLTILGCLPLSLSCLTPQGSVLVSFSLEQHPFSKWSQPLTGWFGYVSVHTCVSKFEDHPIPSLFSEPPECPTAFWTFLPKWWAGSQHEESHPWQGHAAEIWWARRVKSQGVPLVFPRHVPQKPKIFWPLYSAFSLFWHSLEKVKSGL